MQISKGIQYMLLASVFFALMNLCVKALGKSIPATEIIIFRSIVALFVTYFILKKQKISPWGNNRKLLILRGLAGTGGLLFYFYTLQRMPLASAVTIQYLSPIFTIFFAIFILKEKTKLLQWSFFLLAFIGVAFIKGFDSRISNQLLIIGICAAMFSGLAYNFVRKLKDYDHPLVVVFYFPLVSIPIILPFAISNWVMPNCQELFLLVLIGILTQVAQVYMTKAYQLEKVNQVSSIRYLGVVYALSFGFFFFNETYTWLSLLGMLLVISGILLNIFFKKMQN